jgi:hypothetical protein
MPSWAVGYLVILAIVTVGGAIDDVRSHGRWWHAVAGVASAGALGFFFAGYWHLQLVRKAGLVGPLVFLAAVAWEAWAVTVDIRGYLQSDPRAEPGSLVERVFGWTATAGGIAAFSFGFLVGGIGLIHVWRPGRLTRG